MVLSGKSPLNLRWMISRVLKLGQCATGVHTRHTPSDISMECSNPTVEIPQHEVRFGLGTLCEERLPNQPLQPTPLTRRG